MFISENKLKIEFDLTEFHQRTLWRSFQSGLPIEEHVGALFALKLLLYVLLCNGRYRRVIQIKPVAFIRCV